MMMFIPSLVNFGESCRLHHLENVINKFEDLHQISLFLLTENWAYKPPLLLSQSAISPAPHILLSSLIFSPEAVTHFLLRQKFKNYFHNKFEIAWHLVSRPISTTTINQESPETLKTIEIQ